MSISKKIGLPLLLTVVGGIFAYAEFAWFLSRTRSDAAYIELSAMQGVRVQHVGSLSYALVQGYEWAREPLQSAIEELDRDIARLEEGDADGDAVDAVPRELRTALRNFTTSWDEARPLAIQVSESAPEERGSAEAAYLEMRPLLQPLGEAVAGFIRASRDRSSRLRARTRWLLGLIALIDVALMATGYVLIRRFVVEPLERLEESAVRFRDGDYAELITVSSTDEIGHLAEALNAMATSMRANLDRETAASAALRKVSARLLRAQDTERRRLARELHDSTVQTLGAVSIRLSMPPAASRGDVDAFLAESRQLIDDATNELRSLTFLLHPAQADGVDFDTNVRHYVKGFVERSSVDVELRLDAPLGHLSDDLELTLFRVLQEGLSNIHRHSGSDKAEVTLKREDSNVVLELRDGGRGMSDDDIREVMNGNGAGVGLAGMRERLIHIGGQFEMFSSKRGLTIRVVAPAGSPA